MDWKVSQFRLVFMAVITFGNEPIETHRIALYGRGNVKNTLSLLQLIRSKCSAQVETFRLSLIMSVCSTLAQFRTDMGND